MNDIEKTVLDEVTGGTEPRLCLRTKTGIDAGRWWRKTPLWLCVTDDMLIVFAVARRHYIQCAPLPACQQSRYCHATGQLVIEPVEELEYDRLAMSPADALRVLDAMGCKVK